jgi:hypothetical protein
MGWCKDGFRGFIIFLKHVIAKKDPRIMGSFFIFKLAVVVSC